jgi:hypothetical protein
VVVIGTVEVVVHSTSTMLTVVYVVTQVELLEVIVDVTGHVVVVVVL